MINLFVERVQYLCPLRTCLRAKILGVNKKQEDINLNKLEINRFFEYLFCLPFSLPLLRDMADLAAGKNRVTGPLKRRIERYYIRLCRLQEELGRLELKKAALGATLGISGYKTFEDFAFSQIDFSRYRKMDEKDFDELFPEGLRDFDETFFKKNFNLGRREIQSVIEGSYKKIEGQYMLKRETPLVLSLMRTLETSLETSPLFSAGEINEELQKLLDFIEGGRAKGKLLPGMERLFSLLVLSLDNVLITHGDGMTTKLFISPGGDLSGTFRPGNKPWTLVLIPAELTKTH